MMTGTGWRRRVLAGITVGVAGHLTSTSLGFTIDVSGTEIRFQSR